MSSARHGKARPSPKPTGGFRVARSKDTVYVQVIGLGTMNNSSTFKGFADQMTRKGYRHLVCDLGPCRGVDSTFMGLLAGLRGDLDGLVIINAGAHCRQQLGSVGLDCILQIEERPQALPAGVVLHELPSRETAGAIERLKMIMRAHEALVRVDRRNEEKFGAFLRNIASGLGEGGP